MDGIIRRRGMKEEEQTEEVIPVTWKTWGANTRFISNEIIDAREKDVYISINYYDGFSGFKAGVTESSLPYGIMGVCHSDPECTQFVGYYYGGTFNSSFTTAGVPKKVFTERHIVAPRGYYVQPCLIRNGDVFTSNTNAQIYARDYANEVILK